VGSLDVLLGRTLVIVAHPDDEAAGCGALLQRMEMPILLFASDGAPRDEFFWKRHGSRLRYARMREEEARQALGQVGVSEVEFLAPQGVGLDAFADQELYCHLPQAYERMGEVIHRFRPQALITLAYEGGHPDHDACCFLTCVLARKYALPAWEFPLYHRMPSGQMAYQRFLVPDQTEVLVEITPEELERKRAMLRAYKSQGDVMKTFDPAIERLRPLHEYDYTRPPHPGKLNYEVWGWRMTGAQVCAAFSEFLQQEQLQRP
jgi:LmbE family N-acetylglucosaminyl deacetylase